MRLGEKWRVAHDRQVPEMFKTAEFLELKAVDVVGRGWTRQSSFI